MPCLFAFFAVAFPRLGTILIWLARPNMISAAFKGSWFWPLLGIVFLPFTTLMYVILWPPGTGLTGLDWFWLAMAVVVDLMHYASMATRRRLGTEGYSTPPKA